MSTTTPSKALVPVGPSRKGRAAYVTKQAASTAGWQVVRSPLYAWRVVLHGCRGTWYTLPPLIGFIWAGDKREAARQKLKAGQADAYSKLNDKWWHAVVLRSCLVFGPPLLILASLYNRIGPTAYGIVGGTLLLALAFIGSRIHGETILDIAPPRRKDLTQERLDDALRARGLIRKPRDEYDSYGTSVEIRELPHREGSGIEVLFDLPPGSNRTALDVVAQKEGLASELGVLSEQLVLQTTREHAGQVRLWLADEDPFAGGAATSPYPSEKRTDVWEGFRIGTDARGDEAVIPMVWESHFIGGLPRQGKSTIGRLAAAHVALDPYCDCVVLDFKGGKDWKPMLKFASRSVLGADPEDVKATLETLRDLVRMMDERYKLIQSLDDEECPDGKLTPELAESRGLRPVAVFIDELQEALAACDKQERKELEEMLARLARKGPACGIIILVMSQRPDAKSVPAQFRGVVSTRIAVHSADRISSDLVLGEGASARGLNAARLPHLDASSGMAAQAMVVCGASSGQTVKVDWLSLPDFRAICERGYLLRSAAGTLREEEDKAPVNLLDVVIRELEKQDGLSAEALCERIRDFEEIKPVSLGKRLAGMGLRSKETNAGRRYFLAAARAALG